MSEEDEDQIILTDPSDSDATVKPSITGILVELERLRGADKVSYTSMKSITLLLASHEKELKELRELKANLKGGTKVILIIGALVSFCASIAAALFSGKFSR